MDATVRELLKHLTSTSSGDLGVIHWGAPIPAFGNPKCAEIATLGLNPSNREFVDRYGVELDGGARRFHTLRSLKLPNWKCARASDVAAITQSCVEYFARNPYGAWFDRLQEIISDTGLSYRDSRAHACHLDLVPYATATKWSALEKNQRQALLAVGAPVLGQVLRDSSIKVLIANGRGVVDGLQLATGVNFNIVQKPDWNLASRSRGAVRGIAFLGSFNSIGGVRLDRSIQVLGFNHNIQSSFGVTLDVRHRIGEWVCASSMWNLL